VERPSLLVDTGPLYSVADRDDGHYAACLDFFARSRGPFIVPDLVVAEVAYLISSRLGTDTEIRFLGSLARGRLVSEPVHPGDWIRIAELVARYRDFPLGTVDASVVAAAERLGITKIATLDRRHFSVVRPAHVESFELLP
jgi:predicted nucleic acid-binding protein